MNWLRQKLYGTEDNGSDEVLGKDTATPEQIIQTLKLKRMQQMQQSHKLEGEARAAFERGDRSTASQLLQQKGILDTRVRQMNGQLHNMEQQRMAMDSAAISAQMARSMKVGTDQMQRVVNSVSLEDVEEVADTLDDLTQQSFDMTDHLSRPVMARSYMPADMEDQIEDQFARWSSTEKNVSSGKQEEVEVDVEALLASMETPPQPTQVSKREMDKQK